MERVILLNLTSAYRIKLQYAVFVIQNKPTALRQVTGRLLLAIMKCAFSLPLHRLTAAEQTDGFDRLL